MSQQMSSNHKPTKDVKKYKQLTIELSYDPNLTNLTQASDYVDRLYDALHSLSAIGHAAILLDDDISEGAYVRNIDSYETEGLMYYPFDPDLIYEYKIDDEPTMEELFIPTEDEIENEVKE